MPCASEIRCSTTSTDQILTDCSYAVPRLGSPRQRTHALVPSTERSFSMPSVAVQQAFPVPGRRIQPRPPHSPGFPTLRSDGNRWVSAAECSTPPRPPPFRERSAVSSRHGPNEVGHRSERSSPGCRTLPSRADSMSPEPRARGKVDEDSPNIDRLHASNRTGSSSPSSFSSSSTPLPRAHFPHPEPAGNPSASPKDGQRGSDRVRRVPQGLHAPSLDAAGVERALLHVISEVVASCNSGDHDHLRRLDQFARDLSSTDKAM